MSTYVYTPKDIEISIGVPTPGINLPGGLLIPTNISIKDWVALSVAKPNQRFKYSRGVLGEPFVEMTQDGSRIFTLSILQTSDNIEQLDNLFKLQLIGILGFPFFIRDIGTDSNSSAKRYKGFSAVSWIIDEPAESYTLQGGTWNYQIQTVNFKKAYL